MWIPERERRSEKNSISFTLLPFVVWCTGSVGWTKDKLGAILGNKIINLSFKANQVYVTVRCFVFLFCVCNTKKNPRVTRRYAQRDHSKWVEPPPTRTRQLIYQKTGRPITTPTTSTKTGFGVRRDVLIYALCALPFSSLSPSGTINAIGRANRSLVNVTNSLIDFLRTPLPSCVAKGKQRRGVAPPAEQEQTRWRAIV